MHAFSAIIINMLLSVRRGGRNEQLLVATRMHFGLAHEHPIVRSNQFTCKIAINIYSITKPLRRLKVTVTYTVKEFYI